MLPTITFSLLQDATSEDGPGLFYIFKRSGDLSSLLRVNFMVGGSAINGTDYALSWPNVVFVPGSDTATLTVRPVRDARIEGTETLALRLLDRPTRYIIGTPGSVVGFIRDGALFEGPDPEVTQPGFNWHLS
jgi:hypothetical protein